MEHMSTSRVSRLSTVVAMLVLTLAGRTGTAAPPVTNAPSSTASKAVWDLIQAGRWTAGISSGEAFQSYRLEALLPLLPSDRMSLLLNPRGVFLEDRGHEANLGLVARRLFGRSVIAGANVYGDWRRTDDDHAFAQVGGGVELLTRWMDARCNLYQPLTDAKEWEAGREPLGSSPGAGFRQLMRLEEAMEGFDAEIGVWLPALADIAPTGLFVGYARYESDIGASDVDGFMCRIESRIHPNITLDLAWFDDTGYRESEYLVGARVHLPLDFWNGWRMNRAHARTVPPFATRLNDPVQRDFRVQIAQASRAVVSPPQPVKARRVAPSPSPEQPTPPPPPAPLRYTDYTDLNENGEVITVRVYENGIREILSN